jgi:hypothetical protein
MQTAQYGRHSHHGCGQQSHGPEVFYGYCHDTNRMRMMDYPDYMNNMQTGMSNLMNSPSSSMQTLLDALSNIMQTSAGTGTSTPGAPAPYGQHHHHRGHHHKHGCGCGCGEKDCACSCCIRCADVIEYARCSETRVIPISFDNDTRRERSVTLQLGNFATESGQDLGWKAAVTPATFTLPPCGETTVLLTVNVDCSKWGIQQPAGANANEGRAAVTIDGCKVAYATLRADGCTVRPIVVAVAVLPGSCGAHRAGCGCGCCN